MCEVMTLQIPEKHLRILQGLITNYADKLSSKKQCDYCGGENVHLGDCPIAELYEMIVAEEALV